MLDRGTRNKLKSCVDNWDMTILKVCSDSALILYVKMTLFSYVFLLADVAANTFNASFTFFNSFLNDFSCVGNETSLFSCSSLNTDDEFCFVNRYAFVTCQCKFLLLVLALRRTYVATYTCVSTS